MTVEVVLADNLATVLNEYCRYLRFVKHLTAVLIANGYHIAVFRNGRNKAIPCRIRLFTILIRYDNACKLALCFTARIVSCINFRQGILAVRNVYLRQYDVIQKNVAFADCCVDGVFHRAYSTKVVGYGVNNLPLARRFRTEAIGNLVRFFAQRYRLLDGCNTAVTRVRNVVKRHPRTERRFRRVVVRQDYFNFTKVIRNVDITHCVPFVTKGILRRIYNGIPARRRGGKLTVGKAYADRIARCVVTIKGHFHVASARIIIDCGCLGDFIGKSNFTLRHLFLRHRNVYDGRILFHKQFRSEVGTSNPRNTEVSRISNQAFCGNGQFSHTAGETRPCRFVIFQIVQMRDVATVGGCFHRYRVEVKVTFGEVRLTLYNFTKPLIAFMHCS